VGLAYAAGSEKLLSREPSGVIRGQKHRDRCNIADDAGAPERSLCDQLFLQVGADDASAVCAFGLNHTGIDCVDADLLWSQFPSQHSGDGIESSLGAGIDGGVGRCETADAGADVNDTAPFAQVFGRCLGSENRAQNIDVEHLVEAVFGDRLERRKLVNPGIVDQDIEASVLLDGGIDDALGVGGFGNVASHGNCLAPGCRNSGDHCFRAPRGNVLSGVRVVPAAEYAATNGTKISPNCQCQNREFARVGFPYVMPVLSS
jgi:hypothetical protein